MAILEEILLIFGVIGVVFGALFLALGFYECLRNSSLAEDIQASREKRKAKQQRSADSHPRGN